VQFKVATDVFSGPMDLLLFLVKRQEVDIAEVPIAVIATEFIASLEVLEALAIDQVGEFVELASVLLEIKARALVPRPEETEEPVELVREDLVQRLLEYKQYRDAAVLLEDRARRWDLRFARVTADVPTGRGQAAEVSIGDVHVWDLVGAMSRVLRKREKRRPRQIVHDDTPIETHMERIEGLVTGRGKVAFSELFEEAMPRSRLVGMFLAILELVRRHRLAARQEGLFDEIWLEPPPVVPQSPPAATGSPASSTETSAPPPAAGASSRAESPPAADPPA
jgi:segregation and condensation protein A